MAFRKYPLHYTDILLIWIDLANAMEIGQGRLSLLPVSRSYSYLPVDLMRHWYRYWVIAVIPYLLFCFVVNHTREVCKSIYRVRVSILDFDVNWTHLVFTSRPQSCLPCGTKLDRKVRIHLLSVIKLMNTSPNSYPSNSHLRVLQSIGNCPLLTHRCDGDCSRLSTLCCYLSNAMWLWSHTYVNFRRW